MQGSSVSWGPFPNCCSILDIDWLRLSCPQMGLQSTLHVERTITHPENIFHCVCLLLCRASGNYQTIPDTVSSPKSPFIATLDLCARPTVQIMAMCLDDKKSCSTSVCRIVLCIQVNMMRHTVVHRLFIWLAPVYIGRLWGTQHMVWKLVKVCGSPVGKVSAGDQTCLESAFSKFQSWRSKIDAKEKAFPQKQSRRQSQ